MSDPFVQSIIADLPVPMNGTETMLHSPMEPMAVARALLQERYSVPGQRLLRHWRGGFWHWRESHWAELNNKAIRAVAYRFTEHASYVDTSKGEVKPWAPNRRKIADLLEAMAAVCYLHERVQPPTWAENALEMPPADELVSVRNGLLHIATGELYGHDPRCLTRSLSLSTSPLTPGASAVVEVLGRSVG